MTDIAKNTICIWYDTEAEEAAQFYAKTFPNSSVGAVHRAPADNPSNQEGAVLTVEFNVMGVACSGSEWWIEIQTQRSVFISSRHG